MNNIVTDKIQAHGITADKIANNGFELVSKATKIKAEIFDIIVTQENLQGQINQLQEIKQQKLQTLQQALAEKNKINADLVAAESVPLEKMDAVIKEAIEK